MIFSSLFVRNRFILIIISLTSFVQFSMRIIIEILSTQRSLTTNILNPFGEFV